MRTLGWLVVTALVTMPVLGVPPAMAGPATLSIGPGPSLPGLGGIGGRPSPAPPPNDAHPLIPWSPAGRVLRYVWVPPQTIVVDTAVPWPTPAAPDAEASAAEAGAPEVTTPEAPAPVETSPQFGTLRQTFVVPGYHVIQTIRGLQYPARWTLQPLGAGAYQWRLLPPVFQPN